MDFYIFFYSLIITISILFILKKYKFSPASKSIKFKHVVITGGSSGIGKSVAIEAAKHGAHVTIIARDKTKLESAKDEISRSCINNHQKIQAISLDVTLNTAVEEVLQEIDRELPVYMLVNCAGLAICGELENLTIDAIKTLININLIGSLYPTRTLVPLMKKRSEGIVVVTASQAALLGIFGLSVYSATKYALRGFAEALDMELRPYNISVTLSLPPDTDTPGLQNENKGKPIETKLISESGGLFQPEDVAKRLLNDALVGKFYSYIGFESFMISTLCCGMTPFISFIEVIIQALLMGPLRLICSFYILQFQKIVKQHNKIKK